MVGSSRSGGEGDDAAGMQLQLTFFSRASAAGGSVEKEERKERKAGGSGGYTEP